MIILFLIKFIKNISLFLSQIGDKTTENIMRKMKEKGRDFLSLLFDKVKINSF
jgi:hypothetical protein